MAKLPLLFFHEGKRSRLLAAALRCAQNTGSEPLLLGDGKLALWRTRIAEKLDLLLHR